MRPGSRYLGKQCEFDGRILRVVYLEGANGIFIVSLWWMGEYD
jgi:hypothetical protein